MQLAAQQILWGGKRKPYKCELEYLESTGTQYIQTDYTPTIFHDFKAVVAMMDLGDAQFATSLGTAKSTAINGMIPMMIRDGSVSGWRIASFVSIGGSAGEVHTITSRLVQLAGYPDYWEYVWYDSGSRLGSSYQPKSNPIVWLGKMTVFACSYDNGTVNRFSKSRFYSFSAVDVNSGEKVIDLIPVLDLSDTPCIYDRVSGKLFYNAGTGDFVAGPEIWPVEYIGSTGTQWIDTGEIGTENTRIEAKWTLLSQPHVYPAAWGARTTSRVNDFQLYYNNAQVGGNATSVMFRYGGSQLQIDATSIDPTFTDGLNGKVLTFANEDSSVIINGKSFAITYSAFTTPLPIAIFGQRQRSSVIDNAGAFRYEYLIMRQYNNLVRHYKAVRVGSGSTWEGAMLDTVERKVYRNAGTGAFLYGNDV